MNPRHLGNRGASTDVDENLVGLEDFIVDPYSVGRLKAGMALDYGTIFKSSQPFLYALVRPSGNFILTCFNTLHVHAHIAVDIKTIFRTSAGDMGRVRAGHKCHGRDASRVHACAAKLVPFDNGDPHACCRKPRRQRRACLARPDDDCIVVVHWGNASPVCSRTYPALMCRNTALATGSVMF